MPLKKKVLFFVGSGVGGAERMTIRIGKFLDENKYQIKFVIIGKNKGDIKNFIPEQYCTDFIFIRNIYDFTTCKLINFMKKEKPNIVFSSSSYLNVRVITAAKLVGNIKIVVRSENKITSLPNITKHLVKLTYKYADVIIAQQKEMKQELLSYLNMVHDKIVVLHNPIDTELIDSKIKDARSPYKQEHEIKFVWVGRFAYTKGQDLLVQAFNIVHKKLPNSHLFLIGKYDETSSFFKNISSYIHSNKLTEYIHLVGFDTNPYRWIYFSDCFVQPSRLEGLPNALVEGMYLKRPVVATECIPIINRIVKDGFNGYIVPNEDVNSLADSMIKALSLKNFYMTYKPASESEFTNLF